MLSINISVVLLAYNAWKILTNWYITKQTGTKIPNCIGQCIMSWMSVASLISSFVYAFRGLSIAWNYQAWKNFSSDNEIMILAVLSIIYFITNLLYSITFWILIIFMKA